MRNLVIGILIAFVFWFVMFSPFTAQKINFWAVMFLAGITLSTFSVFSLKSHIRNYFNANFKLITIGIASAFVLYIIFLIGKILTFQIFDFSQPQVTAVYSTKQGTPIWLISVLLLFIIGPAEEIFWRGFVLTKLNDIYSKKPLNLIIATLLYTLVHIWSLNLMLLVAAFVCGLFWGYLFLKYKSLVPVIISHSLWDFTVFVLLPFN